MADLNESISGRRRNTRSLIFDYIYASPVPCSKQDIARALSLSLPTVYLNISELEQSGYIEVCGSLPSTGGRPAVSYKVVNTIRSAIGISITSHCLNFAATNLSKAVIAHKTVNSLYAIDDVHYSQFVAEELECFISENDIDRATLLGVGITLAGIILPESNTVFYAPTLSIKDLSLQSLIKAIPYPIYAENDASSGGFAEWYNGREKSNIAFINIEEGVGGAVLVNGGQYIGNNYRSGEFGHMCVEWNGRHCACGRKGCLEAYCSPSRIVNDSGCSIDEFFEKLKNGDRQAQILWADYKKHLVIGIHNIRMALDCDVVLGGFLSEYISPYLSEVKAMLAESDPFDQECSYLRISKSPRYSSILGVALSFISNFVSNI